MEIHFLSLKRFKRSYFQILLVSALVTLVTYILMSKGMIFLGFVLVEKMAIMTMNVAILISIYIFNHRVQKRLKELERIADFEEKVNEYEGIYNGRLYWLLASCLVSCFFYLITFRNYFFFWAVIDVGLMLPYYPNKFVFKRELKVDDIEIR